MFSGTRVTVFKNIWKMNTWIRTYKHLMLMKWYNANQLLLTTEKVCKL